MGADIEIHINENNQTVFIKTEDGFDKETNYIHGELPMERIK
jgi:hypothetical protein